MSAQHSEPLSKLLPRLADGDQPSLTVADLLDRMHDRAHTALQRRTMELLSPAAALANATKVERLHTTTDYTVIDPALPPFIAKTTAQFRARILAKDTGDVTEEAVYSDYRRVKCYDDRFEVKIGPPSASDFLPE